MKRICALLLATAVIAVMLCVPVSADGALQLLPADGDWFTHPNGGYECTGVFEGDTAVFSGSGPNSWPDAYCYYAPENYIIADIDLYTLHYDFNVTGGYTNIKLVFSKSRDEADNGYSYTLSNTTLGDVVYDSGSGDLGAGDFSGYIALSDFVQSTCFLQGETFDTTYINENNELVISGVQIYSVSGGVITFNALEIIANEDVPEITESSEEESPSQAPDDESSAAEASKDDASKAESSEAPDDSSAADDASKAESSADASSAADESSKAPAEKEPANLTWLWVVVGIVGAAVVVTVILVLTKKKK